MGKGRIWTSEEKAKIVVQGLKGRAVSEICNEYQIHQTQYYKWREQFLLFLHNANNCSHCGYSSCCLAS